MNCKEFESLTADALGGELRAEEAHLLLGQFDPAEQADVANQLFVNPGGHVRAGPPGVSMFVRR